MAKTNYVINIDGNRITATGHYGVGVTATNSKDAKNAVNLALKHYFKGKKEWTKKDVLIKQEVGKGAEIIPLSEFMKVPKKKPAKKK